MSADAKRAILRRSAAQEKRTADQFGGRRQPGSGNGWKHKNDVRTPRFLIENKTKARDGATQITIKREALIGVRNNAAKIGLTGLLQFDLGGRQYVIAEVQDFLHELGVEEL